MQQSCATETEVVQSHLTAQQKNVPNSQNTNSDMLYKANKILLPGAFIGACIWGLDGAVESLRGELKNTMNTTWILKRTSSVAIQEGKYGLVMGYFWPVTVPFYMVAAVLCALRDPASKNIGTGNADKDQLLATLLKTRRWS